MRTPTRSSLLAACWFLAGCGSGGEGGRAGGAPSGPTLIPVDSVLLAESDSVYIGKPGKPTVDPYDGSFYVPDFFSNQVYRFGRDGRLLRIYGGPGQGPGEFRSVTALFIPDDSTVIVVDAGNGKLTYFDRTTGALRFDTKFPGWPEQDAPLVLGDTVWMAAAGQQPATSLVRFTLGDREFVPLGRPPGIYLVSMEEGAYGGQYARFFTWGGFLTAQKGRILHGFRVPNWIFVRDQAGTVLDSVFVPVVRRRGEPPDLQARLDSERMNTLEALEATSMLLGVSTLPGGAVALVHHDVTLLGRRIPPPTAVIVWVSLLSADLERACVDAKLSDSEDAKPMEAFRGDTVFQLERRIVGKEGPPGAQRLETWLRIVRIDPSGCDWIPARPPEGGG